MRRIRPRWTEPLDRLLSGTYDALELNSLLAEEFS